MGRLGLQKAHLTNKHSENIAAKFNFAADEEEISKICDFLTNSHDLINSNRATYLFGFGSQPKSVYRQLKQDQNGYEVLWIGYNGPMKFKILTIFAASTSGFIRINKKQCITNLLKTLSHWAMVGIFSCSTSFSDTFEKQIINNAGNGWLHPEDFIKSDKSFFYWIMDGDTFDDSLDGFLCRTEFGIECPQGLTKVTDFIHNEW